MSESKSMRIAEIKKLLEQVSEEELAIIYRFIRSLAA